MHFSAFSVFEHALYLVRYEGVLEKNKNAQRTDWETERDPHSPQETVEENQLHCAGGEVAN